MDGAERSPQVLVTGAGGVMGERLVRGLLERGCRVRGLVLPGDPSRASLERLGVEVREGDVSRPSTLSGVCEDVHTVFHLAAVILATDPAIFSRVNRDGTAHVLGEARGAGVSHFVYVSSASVTYPKRTPYAESKLAAEFLVRREAALGWTIVRPTLVYDARGGQEFVLFRDYLERFPVVPFIGDGSALKRPVLTDDLVDGFLRLLGARVSYGKIYNFSGGEAISMRDFAKLILEHRGRSRRFVHLPLPICRGIAALAGLVQRTPLLTPSAIAGIVNDADLDPIEAMRDLGYRPAGVRAGFARCFPLTTAGAGEPRRAAEPVLTRTQRIDA
jgi:NADH dehydrogenase